ncbi:hypothetical protein Skr01_72750 [Sphaerisporangium krabiense]|uniref:Uncharacterized protein n=1 Tax=Sphaerisporangium krabiense TaxID=763782 RepID=A0A7W8Z6T8_9ACTN|nr:hypothetical protein [Sphaerisporangium krabiense]MBB5628548.1 hypothetical protein [Sphaerisporangium krabiense]GII67190.1 hypothetical protein Skr01_72750 [Sphaerisporangium krabiense]
MALQSLQITPITAMRARDVSRPSDEQQDAADRRPLRDEAARKADVQKRGERGAEPARRAEGRRRG